MVFEWYIKPILYIVGIPGNLLSLILWVQPRLRNSSGCYFAALSVSDTIVLLLHLVLTLDTAGISHLLMTTFLCEMFNVFFVSSECLSLLLVLGLTVDRFIIVCYPMRRHRLCTVRRTVRTVGCLVALSLAMGLLEGSFWIYSVSHRRCEPATSLGGKAAMEVGNVVILITGVIVPALLVILFNVIIILSVQRGNRQRRELCHGTSSHIDKDATTMLLSVSCYVILAELPDEIAYLIQPFYPEGNTTIAADVRESDPTWRSHYIFSITTSVLSVFSLTNYAVDIFIYSLTGRKFREMVMLILRYGICRKDVWEHFAQRDSLKWTFTSSRRANQDLARSPRFIHNRGSCRSPSQGRSSEGSGTFV